MNFTHAAHDLNLTQPAVSQHIKYLEMEYDAPLFVRDKKKLTLTPAGEILRSALETMRNDENTMKIRMKESLCGKKILTFGVTFPFCIHQKAPRHRYSRSLRQYANTTLFFIRGKH